MIQGKLLHSFHPEKPRYTPGLCCLLDGYELINIFFCSKKHNKGELDTVCPFYAIWKEHIVRASDPRQTQ
jgi:hypothetical protein